MPMQCLSVFIAKSDIYSFFISKCRIIYLEEFKYLDITLLQNCNDQMSLWDRQMDIHKG